jgi:AcrR family transcriptional regulator
LGGSYKPPKNRELRAQGRRTLRRLLDAGLEVFAARGYHAARVDDIVRAARTSHGTFYLYFASKEDLLRALAVECAEQYEQLATDSMEGDSRGVGEIEEFVAQFFAIYRRFGPVIRAWMEDHVTDREVNRLGVEAFTHIAAALDGRLREYGAPHDPATVGALMALLERSAYYSAAGEMMGANVATVGAVVRRGFFANA